MFSDIQFPEKPALICANDMQAEAEFVGVGYGDFKQRVGEAVVEKLVPPTKAALVELNIKALQAGRNFGK